MVNWIKLFLSLMIALHASASEDRSFKALENKAIESLAALNVTTLKDTENVRYQLEVMYNVDRRLREEFKISLNSGIHGLLKQMSRCYTSHLKTILTHYKWINISQFGEEADAYAWALVQHSDHDVAFQKKCLKILFDCLLSRETDPGNYACLYDRVAKNEGRLQRYGTQLKWENNQWVLIAFEGSKQELNQRRQMVGLGPIDEYVEQVLTANNA